MKKLLILVMLATVSAIAIADSSTPVPAPNPAPQDALSAAANQNATDGYDAGVANFAGQAYQAAAQTAQGIASQDTAQAAMSMDPTELTEWQQAISEAQSVASDQLTLSADRASVVQQGQSSQNNDYTSELNAVPGVQQANDSAAQSAANDGTASSLSGVASQTGVQQGQVSMISDTSYLLAGAVTQALMNGLSTSGYQANWDAITAYQTAMACGAVPGCAAFWMGVNAMYQSEADADYAANVAAAPTLGTALNGAALSTVLSDAGQQLQQIQGLTGVTQGQNAGATTTAQAMQQTTAQTGVATGQSATVPSTDTSYTSAADSQQSTLNSLSQQNQNDAWTAAQSWQAGLNAQYAEQAASTIKQYDISMESSVESTDPLVWVQAAAIAQTAEDQQASVYDAQSSNQNLATTDENNTYSSANALAPTISDTLDTAAANAAISTSQATLQQIGADTGVSQ